MELRARPPGRRHASSNTVSVAELLVRCVEQEHVPRSTADRATDTAISVTALLRREGRGPHAADRPLKPRGHSRPAPQPPGPSRRSVRKAAVAAGALFAAGAVFSTAVVDTVASPRGDVDLATGPGDLSAGDGDADPVRGAEPSDPDKRIALTVVAENLVSMPPAGSGETPIPSAKAGRAVDLFGRWAFGSGALWSTRSAPPAGTFLPISPPVQDDRGSAGRGESTLLSLLLPDLRTPAVDMPERVLDLPVVGAVGTPRITLPQARIEFPDVTISRSGVDTPRAGISDSTVTGPGVEVAHATARLSRAVTATGRMPADDVAVPEAETSRARPVLAGDGGEVVGRGRPLDSHLAAVADLVSRERDTSAPAALHRADRAEPTATAERFERGSDERTGRDRVRKAAESARSAVGRLLGRT